MAEERPRHRVHEKRWITPWHEAWPLLDTDDLAATQPAQGVGNASTMQGLRCKGYR